MQNHHDGKEVECKRETPKPNRNRFFQTRLQENRRKGRKEKGEQRERSVTSQCNTCIGKRRKDGNVGIK